MRRSTVRYGRFPQVDHDMGTGSPILGFSRSNIAQLNRSHPYSSRWATVAFYLEQDTTPSSSARCRKSLPGGIFCSGSLTTAAPKPAATNESASVLSPKPLSFVAFKNGSSTRREEGAYLDRYVTDEQRSSRPIFNAILRAAGGWLFSALLARPV
jgi:hypothetical protein